MDAIRVEQVRGEDAKPAIDEFYKQNDSKGIARKDDLFFVAYSESHMVGCVRFCVEEGTPMLRTMRVDSSCQRRGVGKKLLTAFGEYLERNKVENVFCLPYAHLEKFYGLIDFETVAADDVPRFLIDRANGYAQNGMRTIFMRRL